MTIYIPQAGAIIGAVYFAVWAFAIITLVSLVKHGHTGEKYLRPETPE